MHSRGTGVSRPLHHNLNRLRRSKDACIIFLAVAQQLFPYDLIAKRTIRFPWWIPSLPSFPCAPHLSIIWYDLTSEAEQRRSSTLMPPAPTSSSPARAARKQDERARVFEGASIHVRVL